MQRQGVAKSRTAHDVWSSQSSRTPPPPVPYHVGPHLAEGMPTPPVPPTRKARRRRASGVTFWAARSTCADGPMRSIWTLRLFRRAGCRLRPLVDDCAGGARHVRSLHDQECVWDVDDESGQPQAWPKARVPGGKNATSVALTALLRPTMP